ncbi:hypothetical protein D3C80_1264770 [compost metagenome]
MGLALPVRPRPMQGARHDLGRPIQIGQQPTDREKGLVRVFRRIEDVHDHGLEDLRRRLVPDGLVFSPARRVGEDGRQPLHMGELARPGPDFGQGVPAG